MTTGTGGQGTARVRGHSPRAIRGWLVPYLAVQLVLAAIAIGIRGDAGGISSLIAILLGSAVLTACILWWRPTNRGWWLVAAAGWAMATVRIMVISGYGLHGYTTIQAARPIVAIAAAFALLAAGLAMLANPDPIRGYGDLLDAAMIALASFLLLWALLIDPHASAASSSVLIMAVFLIGALVLIAFGVRLALGGGLRHPSTAVVLIAAAALVGEIVSLSAPVLGQGALKPGSWSRLMFLTFAVAIGAAGLTLRARSRPPRPRGSESDTGRVIVFVALALVPPTAWAIEIVHGRPAELAHALAAWVPLSASAAFLLVLVLRLTLIARVADRRATEVSQRSAALAAAMTEQAELQRELTDRAFHDPLTGLFNRDVLNERLRLALAGRVDGARPESRTYALLLLDLDGFKDVNDTFGHSVGDEMLVEVSRRLIVALPAEATLARLGGDEFAVLLAGVEPAQAVRTAEAVLDVFRQSYTAGGRELFLTTSVGVLITDPTEVTTPSDVLRDADLALYAAKEAGRNRLALFHPDLRAARRDHALIGTGLRRALTNDEFVLHYQPVVDLEEGTVASVEALVRWRRPGEPNLVPPDQFVPVAEETGLISAIGEWVLRRACQDGRHWWDEHRTATTVNVSGRQLADPDFVSLVVRILAETGLPGPALILEITESSLVGSSGAAQSYDRLQALRSLGVRIAIDDFGTGYSSLSYLAKLPVDIVKVDKSFIQEPQGEGVGWAFTNAILRLVESLGLIAVVEGVETTQQADALRELRCPLVQGFLFARPMPAADIHSRLAEIRVPATH